MIEDWHKLWQSHTFPNPSDGNFAIDLGSVYELAKVSITDITGKLIHSKSITDSQAIDFSLAEPAAMYIASIQASDQRDIARLNKINSC